MLPVQHKKEEVEEPPLQIHQGEVKGGEPIPLPPKGTSKEVFSLLILTHQTQAQEAVSIQTPR